MITALATDPPADRSEIERLLENARQAEAEQSLTKDRLDSAQSDFEATRQSAYQARSDYTDARRQFILQELHSHTLAMCADCKRLRTEGQVRTVYRMGFVTKSDCSYSQWCEPYQHEHPVCLHCIAEMTFATHVVHGYTVGYELHEFDQEVHDRWITYGSDNLDAAARALKLNLPPL